MVYGLLVFLNVFFNLLKSNIFKIYYYLLCGIKEEFIYLKWFKIFQFVFINFDKYKEDLNK